MATTYGHRPLELPTNFKVFPLLTSDLVENVFSSLMDPLNLDTSRSLVASIDAEWNISRTRGVSIFQVLPHSDTNVIYVIPVRLLLVINEPNVNFFNSSGNSTTSLLPSFVF
jgi:hypothetical protein